MEIVQVATLCDDVIRTESLSPSTDTMEMSVDQ